MPVTLITAPASEPITLGEARTHLRVEQSLDDPYITALITTARQWAEKHCWCGFVTQTWELVTDRFPDELERPAFTRDDADFDGFELPRGALVDVTSLKYIDGSGVEQTLASTEYVVDTNSVPGRVRLAYEKSWPAHRIQWDAVRIRYRVGTAVDAVPQPVKQALLLLVSQMYEHRTPEVTGALVKVQFAVEALLAPYRLVRHT